MQCEAQSHLSRKLSALRANVKATNLLIKAFPRHGPRAFNEIPTAGIFVPENRVYIFKRTGRNFCNASLAKTQWYLG